MTTAQYFDVVLGDREGIVCVAFGRKPFRNERDTYEHGEWTELTYAWPAQRDRFAIEVAREVDFDEPVDIYVNPAIRQRNAKGRRKGDAIPPMVLWSDLDGEPADAELYAELVAGGSLVVSSGSDGHRHPYFPLAHPIDLGTFNRLNEALADRLGGDAKWADNSLLRMPGTFNWKPTVPAAGQLAGRPVAVEVVSHTPGAHDPFKLAERLGVDLSASAGATTTEVPTIAAEPAPDPLPRLVRWALDHPDVTDRSTAHHRLIGACADAGLTPGQALTVVAGYGPSREKYGSRLAAEVARSWGNLNRESTPKPPQNPQNPGDRPGDRGSEGSEGVSPEEWAEPTPLPGRTSPIPTDALGPVLQPMVEAVATALQVPSDLVTNLALPIITTAAGGGWIVEVSPGWTEALCLASVSALPSGERKTPTLAALLRPLKDAEKRLGQEAIPEHEKQKAKKKLAEDRAEDLRRKAVKTGDAVDEEAYLDAVATASKIDVRPLPRLRADDATPEAAVALLADHRAIGLISDEPGLFGILAGKYSSNGAPPIEWFLSATSGAPLIVDRIGRGMQEVSDPALSMSACIQPGRLSELGQVKAFRESGMLARFLFALPQSAIGERGRTAPVADGPATAWAVAIEALVDAGQRNREGPAILRVSSGGQDVLEELRADIEPHLHPDHGMYAGIADWANKMVGTAARIAAAITLLGDPHATVITAATARDAVRIIRAYVGHTIAAFGLVRPGGAVLGHAKVVLGMVRRLCVDNGTDTVSRRDVHQRLRDRAWVEDASSLDEPLQILDVEDGLGHIRRFTVQGPNGGRPSERIQIHPSHLAPKPTHNPQNPSDRPGERGSEGSEGVFGGAATRCAGCDDEIPEGTTGCTDCYRAGRIDDEGRRAA